MRTRGHRAMLVAGLLLAGAPSAFAGSPATDRLLANLVPNVDFLDRSSRFALTNSKSTRLKDYARNVAREQTLAANAIDEWKELSAKPSPALSATNLDQTPTGSVTMRAGAGPASREVEAAQVDDRLPMGQEDLDRLEGVEGNEFDTLYKEKQRDALQQVEADYRDYIRVGEVAALRSLAVRELPKVTRRLTQLGKL